MASQFSMTDPKPDLVDYRVAEGIALLTLNDPPANTYSYDMMQQIDARILEARMDDGVQVILITGSGEKFFCAGANISMLSSVTPEFKYYFCLHANETLNRLEQTPKLVIAAINGHCVGGGLEVAMAADIRSARRNAGKMGLPEVSLGVLPGSGGTQRLSRIVGKSKAIELMATGELFDFEKGRELGLVNQIFDAETGEQLCSRRLITRASLRRQTKPRVPWGELSARCRRAPRFPLNRRWRSNANCSSNYFFQKTRRKAWTPTSINVKHSSRGSERDPSAMAIASQVSTASGSDRVAPIFMV